MKNASTNPSVSAGVTTPPTLTPALAIDAKPVESVAQPMVPPVSLPNQTASSTLGSPVTEKTAEIAEIKDTADTSVKPAGGYAAVLASKVNADEDKPKENPFDKMKTDVIPTLTVTEAKADDTSGKGGASKAPKGKGKGKWFMAKVLGSIVAVVVLLAGLGAGYFLQTQEQSLQEQAYMPGAAHTDIIPGRLRVHHQENNSCPSLINQDKVKSECPAVGNLSNYQTTPGKTNNISTYKATAIFENLGSDEMKIDLEYGSSWCKDQPYGQVWDLNKNKQCSIGCGDSTKMETKTITVPPKGKVPVEISREADNKTACGSFQVDWFIKNVAWGGRDQWSSSNQPVSWGMCQTGISCTQTPPPQSKAEAPQCTGYNVYKGNFASSEPGQPNATALSGETVSLSSTNDVFTVKHASTLKSGKRPSKQVICWSANGLTAAQYGDARAWVCATTCEVKNNAPTKGANVESVSVTCQGSTDTNLRGGVHGTMEQFIQTLDTRDSEDSSKYSLMQRAYNNGLIFSHQAHDASVSPAVMCATNPYKSGGETGVFFDGKGGETVGSNCGVASDGQKCLRKVKVGAPPVVQKPVCEDVDYGSKVPSAPGVQDLDVLCLATKTAPYPYYRITVRKDDSNTPIYNQVRQKTTGTIEIPFTVSGLNFTNGSYKVTCVPCTDAAGSNCADVTATCTNDLAIGTNACVGTTVNPASVAQNQSGNATVTCKRVNSLTAKSYKLVVPGQADRTQNTPASGDIVFSNIPLASLTATTGTKEISCVPCTGVSGAGTCATVTAACKANLVVAGVGGPTLACAGFKAEPATVNYASPNVTFTCTRATGAVSYKLTYPGTEGSPETKILTQPAGTANPSATFSNAAFLPPGVKSATCVPCSGANGTGCVADTSASCKATFTVSPTPTPTPITENGSISCAAGNKKAFRVSNNQQLANNSVVNRGERIRYEITLTRANAADNMKNDAQIRDTYSAANLTYVANSAKGATLISNTNGQLLFKVLKTDKQASIKITYEMTVNSLPGEASITNSVSIVDNGQGTAVSTTQCTTTQKRAAIGVAKCEAKTAARADGTPIVSSATSPTFVNKGETIKYKIVISAAEQTAGAVTVVDTLPDKLTYVSSTGHNGVVASGNTLTFTLNAFGPSTPKTIEITATAKADATPGAFTNNVSVTTAGTTAAADTSCTHTAAVPPDGVAQCVSKEMYQANGDSLGTKIADGTDLHTGSEFFYKITVNSTSQTAGKVVVTDELPAGMEFVSGMGNEFMNHIASTGVVTKEYPTGINGTQSFNFKVRVKHSASGSVKNIADVVTYNGSSQVVPGSNTSCAVSFDVPKYACDTSCTSNSQCKTFNSDYVCSSGKCRLEDNTSSSSCQAESFYCDKACDTDSQCQTANSAFVCANTDDGKRCRLGSNSADYSCQPPVESTPTPVPTLGCNATCVNNADCSNPSHVCHQGQCRLATNVESTSCTVPLAQGQPTPPAELPQTGPAEWGTWLKAGAVVLGIGALLLLLL